MVFNTTLSVNGVVPIVMVSNHVPSSPSASSVAHNAFLIMAFGDSPGSVIVPRVPLVKLIVTVPIIPASDAGLYAPPMTVPPW